MRIRAKRRESGSGAVRSGCCSSLQSNRQQAPFFPAGERGRGVPGAFFQAKPEIGSANDGFEREADAMADRVAGAGSASRLQRKEGAGTAGSNPAPQPDSINGSGGRPLATATLREMNRAFAADFGNVRIHTDDQAARLSRRLQARAFTFGKDVYFNKGHYDPSSTAGRHLLAHELTHVLQQSGPAGARRIQAALLPRNQDCGSLATLPIHERPSDPVNRGAHFTETFRRPASGRVRVTVTATAPTGAAARYGFAPAGALGDVTVATPVPAGQVCGADDTFGSTVGQCHLISDEYLEDQHVERIGGTIRYEIALPEANRTTYELYWVRIYTNCRVYLDVRVDPV
jgi:hypothetical protein